MAGTGVTHSGSDAWLMWGARETWSALPKGMAGPRGQPLGTCGSRGKTWTSLPTAAHAGRTHVAQRFLP